jgi:hypothetical protein
MYCKDSASNPPEIHPQRGTSYNSSSAFRSIVCIPSCVTGTYIVQSDTIHCPSDVPSCGCMNEVLKTFTCTWPT